MSQKRVFEIVCTDCKKASTVPFQPTKGKPVYCRTCLAKHRQKSPVRTREPITFNVNNAWAAVRNNDGQRKPATKSVFRR